MDSALLVVKGHNGISTLQKNPILLNLYPPYTFSPTFYLNKILIILTLLTLFFSGISHLQCCFSQISMGTSQPCPPLKFLSNKVRAMFCHCGSQNKYGRLDAKLEKKMSEVKKSRSGHSNFKSIDSIILRFPQFREGLKNIKGVFEQYDKDSNGTIDLEELKKCFEELQLHLKEEEIKELFHSCDIDGSEGIQFNEFIVLLCLIYLLMIPSSSSISKMGAPQIQATFDAIVEVFLFLDKNGDGKLNKKDMVQALNETSPWEKSPAHITRKRFKEMDWDRNGKASFREFLFALISWVGIDSDEECTDMELKQVQDSI